MKRAGRRLHSARASGDVRGNRDKKHRYKEQDMNIGFIGLGRMGAGMAANLRAHRESPSVERFVKVRSAAWLRAGSD